jgi:hypothetical protein
MKTVPLLMVLLAGLLHGREFTGKNGKKIDAEIVSRTETQVELKLKDGKTVKVAINSLSSGDQLFVKTWEDPAAKAERLKGIDLGDVMAAKGYFSLTVESGTGQMFVSASINGKQGKFLVDDSAAVPLIKQASLEKFELTMKAAPAQGGPAGGNTVIGTAQPKTFGNESKSFAPPECYVLTLEHFPKNVLEQIDGVIGGQFFVDRGAVLDYSAKKLWLKE